MAAMGHVISVNMTDDTTVEVAYVTDHDSYDFISFTTETREQAVKVHNYWTAVLMFTDQYDEDLD